MPESHLSTIFKVPPPAPVTGTSCATAQATNIGADATNPGPPALTVPAFAAPPHTSARNDATAKTTSLTISTSFTPPTETSQYHAEGQMVKPQAPPAPHAPLNPAENPSVSPYDLQMSSVSPASPTCDSETDTDTDSDAEPVRLDHEEEAKDYKPGGYHPVQVGDVFKDGRYEVVRKLGWGHFSTVWLAKDRQRARHVALKIVRSASHYTETALDEIAILRRLAHPAASDTASALDHPGRAHVLGLWDEFIHVGPNGSHVCMVFEVLGENMLALIRRYNHKGIPTVLVKQITKQVLLALDYLHRYCGIVHTDLKPENILIEFGEENVEAVVAMLEKEETERKTERKTRRMRAGSMAGAGGSALSSASNSAGNSAANSTGMPIPAKPRRSRRSRAHTPVTGSKPLPSPLKSRLAALPDFAMSPITRTTDTSPTPERTDSADPAASFSALSLNERLAALKTSLDDNIISVKIADFGNACYTDHHFTNDIQTRQYRAPEVITGNKWGASADLWSMACIVFELLTGDYLFDPQGDSHYTKDDDHLAQIIELLGEFPLEFIQYGRHAREFFAEIPPAVELEPIPLSISSSQNRDRYLVKNADDDGKPVYKLPRYQLRRIPKLKMWPLQAILREKYKMSISDALQVADFLLPMLDLRSWDRFDAGGMSSHAWLDDTAGMPGKLLDRPFGSKGDDISGWYYETKRKR